jgi:F-type H+-transporting ATPase subunit b
MMWIGLVTRFGDDSSIFGALGISGQAFLIQLVTFIIAFLVLRQWAFKPILRVLDERRQRIEDGLKLGETMEAEKAKLDESVTQELHKARTQADRIVATAETEAKQTVQAAEDTARRHADEIMESAKEQIKHESQRERKRLERELVGLVSEVSEAVIKEKVDARKDAALIDAALRERTAA